MKISSMLQLLLSVPFSLILASHSTTLLVDGISEWTKPTVHVGDSIIFKHKYHYNLYIFQNQKAFNLCNFIQSILLTNLNSTSYTWHPSRPGFYYFTFHNGSLKSCNQHSQKLAVKVLLPAPPPMAAPVPQPISGGVIVPSSPAYPWPFRPREAAVSSPAPVPSGSARSPAAQVADKGDGSSMPFINSNPAVPLPTGEIDSATLRPLPTSGNSKQVEGQLLGGHVSLLLVVLLVLVL